jgi:hypothetical protein
MNTLNYKVIYRNGNRIPIEIANFYRTNDNKFVFEYVENPQYEFPGFDKSIKKYENDHLWEQITFRVPNNIRNQYPDKTPEELLKETEGKLVTDHFEFQVNQEL